MPDRCKSCPCALARGFDSHTKAHQAEHKGAAGIRRVRRLTLLRTMPGLWRDASVVRTRLELSLERGRQAGKKKAQRRERRKEGSAGGPFGRDRKQRRTTFILLQTNDLDAAGISVPAGLTPSA